MRIYHVDTNNAATRSLLRFKRYVLNFISDVTNIENRQTNSLDSN